MPRVPCRCRRCEARRTLPKPPSLYVRSPRCRMPGCGGTLRVDRWMQRRNTSPYRGGQGCTCGGYWFPHRRGSRHCCYRVDGSMRLPGDRDFQDWQPTDNSTTMCPF